MGSSHGIKCSAPGNGDYFGLSSSAVNVAWRVLGTQHPMIKRERGPWTNATVQRDAFKSA